MSAEVVIVGAGVIGAATAFHLARLGAPDVEVIDRATVGSGMSSRSSALVRMHYTFKPEVELAVRSDTMFEQWPDLVGQPSCINRVGFVRIVAEGEEPQLRENVAMQRSVGACVELLDGEQLAEVAPGFRVDNVSCAAFEPNGGYGDGGVVAGDLLAQARRGGVRYRPNTAVRRLIRRGDQIVGVETADGVTHADMVVLATGVWSGRLLGSAGIELPLETEFHQVAVVSHALGRGVSIACIDSTTQTYFRPEAGGARTLIGSFVGPRGVDADDIAQAGVPDELAAMVEATSARVPQLVEAGIGPSVTGAYDMTPDSRPMLGEVPGVAGLVVAIGLSGMGFKISPAVGESVAALVTGDMSTSVDVHPFRPGRFAEGRPIEAPFAYACD